MKKVFLFFFTLLYVSSKLYTQTNTASNNIVSLLFKDVKTKLTPGEKKLIAAKLGFIASGNKEQPFAADKESKEFPFAASVLPTDMNKDGREEIFVYYGNTYTSGNTGSSIVVFIKNKAGVYEPNLGFPGMVPEALSTGNLGYPDLLIGGPGFEFPVWRWKGKAYDFYKSVSDKAYETLKKKNIEDLSKLYQQGIKK